MCAPSRVNSSGRFRKSTISCSSSFASSTPATSSNVTFTSVSATSLAFERPTESSPPPKPPPPARPPIIIREANIQMPTNSSGGSTHDSSVPSAPPSVALPVNSTLCFASWPARSGGTCTVVKLLRPSGIGSVSVPRITLPATVTCFTLLASRYCWNWLYGIASVPPLPPPPPNRPSAGSPPVPRRSARSRTKISVSAPPRDMPPDRGTNVGRGRAASNSGRPANHFFTSEA